MLAVILFVPSVVFASWWNPFSWKEKPSQVATSTAPLNIGTLALQKSLAEKDLEIDRLNKIVVSLSKEKDIPAKIVTEIRYLPCISSSTSTPIVQKTAEPAGISSQAQLPSKKRDYLSYEDVSIQQYIQNPSGFDNKSIVFSNGSVTAFVPFGLGAYSDSGYIKIGKAPFAVMLRFSNLADYTLASSRLNIGSSNLLVWGIGVPSQQFQDFTDSGNIYTAYVPVISVDRITQCRFSNTNVCNKYDTDDYAIFSKE